MRQKLPIFYSAVLLTGVNLLLRTVSTSFQVVISNRIGPAGVGLLQLVLSVGSLALTAGMGGIRTATMYLTAEELGRKHPGHLHWVLRSCALYSLVFSAVVGVLLYTAAPWISAHWIGTVQVCGALRSYALFLPVICLSGCLTGYFTAANRIGTLAAVEIGEQLCYMAVTTALLTTWADTSAKACTAVVWGHGISALVTLISLILLRVLEKMPRSRPISLSRRLLGTAVPLALADDLKAGISTTENLMVPRRLARYAGEAEPLAAFGTVCGMVFPLLMFPSSILFSLGELLIPELARCAAAGSHRRIRYLTRRCLRVGMLYGCLWGGLLFLLGEALCQRMYPGSQAGLWLKRYALLAPMLYTDAVTDAMTKGLGQQKLCVRYNILTSALDVLFLFLLLPRCGMTGYYLSFLVTHAINFWLSLRRLLRITGLSIPLYLPLSTVSVTLISCMLCQTLPGSIPRLLAFLGLYGGSLTLLGIVSRADLDWLRSLAGGN